MRGDGVRKGGILANGSINANRLTYVVIVAHVHATVHHDVLVADRQENATSADILTGTCGNKTGD